MHTHITHKTPIHTHTSHTHTSRTHTHTHTHTQTCTHGTHTTHTQVGEWMKFAITELEVFCRKYEEEETRELEKVKQRLVIEQHCYL